MLIARLESAKNAIDGKAGIVNLRLRGYREAPLVKAWSFGPECFISKPTFARLLRSQARWLTNVDVSQSIGISVAHWEAVLAVEAATDIIESPAEEHLLFQPLFPSLKSLNLAMSGLPLETNFYNPQESLWTRLFQHAPNLENLNLGRVDCVTLPRSGLKSLAFHSTASDFNSRVHFGIGLKEYLHRVLRPHSETLTRLDLSNTRTKAGITGETLIGICTALLLLEELILKDCVVAGRGILVLVAGNGIGRRLRKIDLVDSIWMSQYFSAANLAEFWSARKLLERGERGEVVGLVDGIGMGFGEMVLEDEWATLECIVCGTTGAEELYRGGD